MWLAVRRISFAAARKASSLSYFRGRDRLTEMLLRAGQRAGPPVTIVRDGLTLQLDLKDGLSRNLWLRSDLPQPQTAAMLSDLCQLGDVVLDVGANLGYMALIAARRVGANGQVIAIEPSKRSFRLLSANAELNAPGRVVPIQAACDEVDGTARIFVSDDSEEYSSLRPDAIPGRSHIETVPRRSPRSLLRELGVSVDVAKIDVEGAEWAVLKGLLDDRCLPRSMIVEAYSRNTRQFGYRPSEMCNWLMDQGYDLRLVGHDGTRKYNPAIADGSVIHDVVAIRQSSNRTPLG